jgi:hypothetical protein
MNRRTGTDDAGVRAERGGIVTGWLLKIVLSLAIVAFVVYESGAIVFAHIASDGDATDVSTEAASSYAHSHDVSLARAAAQLKAKSEGASLIAFSIGDGGRTVTVTVEKDANTLLLQHVSFTRSWTKARTTRTQTVQE